MTTGPAKMESDRLMKDKRLYLTLISFTLLIFLLTCPLYANSSFTLVYEVQDGDSLIGIAEAYDLSLNYLLGANGLTEEDVIRVGDQLLIPGQRDERDSKDLFSAKLLESQPVEEEMELEELHYHVFLREIPPAVNISPEDTLVYRIQPGDSLYELARYFNTSISFIKALNEMENDSIRIGQNLILPTDNLTSREVVSRSISSTEREILVRAISGEARGEPLLGQVAVGAVIINRVLSPRFPNTFQEVIYQHRQFSAVDDGQINLPPTYNSRVAADRALAGEDPTRGALFYYNPRTATNRSWFQSKSVIVEIGNHVFAR